jgi:UDP-glucose 4-epimerase
VDNLCNSRVEALRRVQQLTGKEFRFYETDLRDKERMRSLFSSHPIEAVMHFAGLKAVGESVREPLRYYDNNVAGTLTLCEVMQEHGVRRIVFSSSATVYGTAGQLPLNEDAPLGVTNPYGRTKLILEQMLQDLYVSDSRWGVALLRYFNPVGAHKSGLIGEDPGGVPNNLMPYITQVAVGKLKELQVFGHDYPTADGTGIRDYIHVCDLAAGHLKALQKIMAVPGIEAYNLGTGRGYSVLETIRAFENASGRKVPYRLVQRRPGDVAASYADPSKARRELGWGAALSLDEMCEDAWRWQYNNPNGYEADTAPGNESGNLQLVQEGK